MNPESLFSLSFHLERLSKDGDPLEVLERTVDIEYYLRLLSAWTIRLPTGKIRLIFINHNVVGSRFGQPNSRYSPCLASRLVRR